MAVYYDFLLDIGVSSPCNFLLAGHERYSLLAVGCEGRSHAGQVLGAVNIFTEEGHSLDSASVQRSSPPVCMSWHSVHRMLAVAWKSGEVTIYNHDDGDVIETSLVHVDGVVVFLLWNDAGTRLVSGDESGEVAVWHLDAHGKLAGTNKLPSFQHSFEYLAAGVLHPNAESDSSEVQVSELARRAVEGDEAALDRFLMQQRVSNVTSRRAESPLEIRRRKPTSNHGRTQLSFFIGCQKGALYYVSASNEIYRCANLDSGIHRLFYFSQKSMLVAITELQSLTKYTVEADGSVQELSSFKLSFPTFPTHMMWTVPGALAFSAKEESVRVWDFNEDEGYHIDGPKRGDKIAAVAFNGNHAVSRGVLVGGTVGGQLLQWWYNKNKQLTGSLLSDDSNLAEVWEPVDSAQLEFPVDNIVCMGSRNIFAYLHDNAVTILKQGNMSAFFSGQTCAVQTAAGRVLVEKLEKRAVRELRTDIHINGIHVSEQAVLIWNWRQLVVYSIASDGSFRAAGSFDIQGALLSLYKQGVLVAQGREIRLSSYTGVTKQTVVLPENEGECAALTISEPYVIVGTSEGFIRVFDCSRREARSVRSCNVRQSLSNFGLFYNMQSNSNCTLVSFQLKRPNSDVPDCRLFIWDFESDDIHVMDFVSFTTGPVDSGDMNPPLSYGNEEAAALACGRCPVSHFWDKKEPRLLVCECARVRYVSTGEVSPRNSAPESKVDVAAVVMFFTGEHGFLLQDCVITEKNFTGLLGLMAPYIYFSKKASRSSEVDSPSSASDSSTQSVVARVLLRDFSELDEASRSSETTRLALLDFSFHLALGNLDEAFGKVRKVKSKDIWTNLAKMCVKRQRLDVATVCLGNMGDSGALRALRLEKEKHPEPEVHLALVALHLDMQYEAIELYKSCGRYDLLNQYYQSINQWDQALQVARSKDRIHLRNTHYAYAKHLELDGDNPLAATHYEKADTHYRDVPRMLVDRPTDLEEYVSRTGDPALFNYWGSYLESLNEMETAVQFYRECDEVMGQVRVLCYMEKFVEAADLANESGDKAALFHLGRQYEILQMPMQSIEFYSKALAFTNAISVAKDNQMDGDLMGLALRSTKDDMLDVAQYFEHANVIDKAVILYQKGGNVGRALELSFLTKEFSALESIADDLDENTNPDILVQCAEFFVAHNQHDRAVPILVSAKKYLEAMDISLTHKVPISSEMAEKMTLPKSDDPAEMEHRNAILEKVAMCAEEHGHYQLACKKFTQGGMHVNAMKALIKSGDVEKICFFANANRRRDLFIMAANWLHLQDWRNDTIIMKQIVSMYTKGKALDSLAAFYESCAQLEVDDFRNYAKALAALKEAQKYLNKAKSKSTSANLESQSAFLETRIVLTQKFVTAKELLKTDPTQALEICREILADPTVETAIRIGDIIAVMVDHHAQRGEAREAYACMQELRQQSPDVNMAYFIPMSIIESVHRALGIPLGRGRGAEEVDGAGGGGGTDDLVDDDDEDDVADEL